ncbi:MAG TPA: hypothetical protein VE198_18175 [Actinoallomurus sp.]|nr:hypothetical protein [Actinoallomurus sp.]
MSSGFAHHLNKTYGDKAARRGASQMITSFAAEHNCAFWLS